jgi:transposase
MGSVIGLDVHKDAIVAAALDPSGAVRAERTFENTPGGHQQLGDWVADVAPGARCGLEPSGGVGHAAASHLQQIGVDVVLVPSRLSSREASRNTKRGKTDQGDAIAIGRVVQRDDRLPVFRTGGHAEDLKLLVDYRDQLHYERTRVANRLHADLSIAYPGYQRTIGKALTSRRSLQAVTDLLAADRTVRADLARQRLARLAAIDLEMKAVKVQLEALLATTGSTLTDVVGVSTVTASRLIGEIGDIRRFPTPAAFAAGNGTAPLDASSGRHERHRLNRGGNRRLNRAIYVIAITQTRHEPRAVAYVARKRAAGKTRRETLRCLKRRLSDVVYRTMLADAVRLDTQKLKSGRTTRSNASTARSNGAPTSSGSSRTIRPPCG